MNRHSIHAFDADRRDFLRLAAVSAASFAFLPNASAKVAKSLEPVPDYQNLLSKTEEFQEEFLFSLPGIEKDVLLARIRHARPETYAALAFENEWRHLLRTGYAALKLSETRTRRNADSKGPVSAPDILLPTTSPLRPPMP